ncbi:serine/threonine-protein kinase [Dictyobacter aurantiacus]|uniref:non-specific serine/threonine protein kinase n=1 Tax=Dictyobacter aurantiacus TaxID=1936993 RepID=A0A401ZBH1_9CHLR|nr:serine/threonine-protein kinase [Dictyobacter aurantiacus]GCE04068.1 hypothetical protein KDAU_13970 [Dictyobacter aurantiacus]
MNAEELCGKVLGTCTLQKVIGRGGMGAVYLAQQSRPRRQVAVKVLLPITTFKPQQHKAFLERFRRETDAAASLEHPNITPVHEYGELDGLAYLVMPYISGGTLRDELDTEGKLPLTRVVSYLEQMAAALDFAHERKVVHRDIKPANILMTPEKRLLLTDFGLVKIITDGQQRSQNPLSEVGMPMGTPDYMAPEQVIGSVVDARADIYSLGVLLYHMVAGTPPFQGETPMKVALQHLHTPPPLPRMYRPDLPPAAEQVILRVLAKRPVDRYQRARDLASAFRLALEAAGVQVDGSMESGNRRRGLFDPVWQSQMPIATPQQEPVKAAHETVQQLPHESAGKVAQSFTARHDIVAQTRMTLPSFSGILTETDIAAFKSASPQPTAVPGADSLLQGQEIPETPNSGQTPLPPTIGTEVRHGGLRPGARQTPLPPVGENVQSALLASNQIGNATETGNRKMFMPPRLKLGHKTNLRGLHKGASKPGGLITNTVPTMPQPLLKNSPDQGHPATSNEKTTRAFGLLEGIQPGATKTESSAQPHHEPGIRAGIPAADQQAVTGQNKRIATEVLSVLSQLPTLIEWVKSHKKTTLVIGAIILLVLGLLLYMLTRPVSSTPASGERGPSHSIAFTTGASTRFTASGSTILSDHPFNAPAPGAKQGTKKGSPTLTSPASENARIQTQQYLKQTGY